MTQDTNKLLATFFGGIVATFLFGWLVMLLWNWLVPIIFGLTTLGYWESLGLTVLCGLLFKQKNVNIGN